MEYIEQLEKGRFGSFELKRQVGPNLLKGLLVSLLIHGSVIASPLIYGLLWGDEVVVVSGGREGKDTLVVIFPPRPRPPERWQPVLPPSQPTGPTKVILVPVDNEPLDSVKQIASVDDLRRHYQHVADSLDGLLGGGGDRPISYSEPPDDPILPPDTFVAVEIQPQPLTNNPQPLYPELAMKAGLDGKVTVQFFVDRTGKVRQWRVMQVNPVGLGFEEEVLKIIPAWKFTPAIQSGKPVGVWVAVPFRFKVQK